MQAFGESIKLLSGMLHLVREALVFQPRQQTTYLCKEQAVIDMQTAGKVFQRLRYLPATTLRHLQALSGYMLPDYLPSSQAVFLDTLRRNTCTGCQQQSYGKDNRRLNQKNARIGPRLRDKAYGRRRKGTSDGSGTPTVL